MLLCRELLEQVMVGRVWSGLALGQSVAQPVLMGQEHPDLSSSVLGNTYGKIKAHARFRVHKCSKTFPHLHKKKIKNTRRDIFYLGRVHGTSPPCLAGRSFCPVLSVSSPTTPAPLWSTGPLPGSPASSCGCAAHLGSLEHNQKNFETKKKKRNILQITLTLKKTPMLSRETKKTKKNDTKDQLKQGCASKEQF